MEKAFNDIIEKDEKIIKVFKPQKTRFWWGLILATLGILLLIGLWFGWMIVSILEESISNIRITSLNIITTSIICVIVALLPVIIFGSMAYKNRFYAYSNKRILIRSGIIGIDYRTLEFQALTATNVQVTPLDKLLGTKTGTLEFGSPSSPMGTAVSNRNGRFSNPYSFKSVENPYDTLREIKEFMDKK